MIFETPKNSSSNHTWLVYCVYKSIYYFQYMHPHDQNIWRGPYIYINIDPYIYYLYIEIYRYMYFICTTSRPPYQQSMLYIDCLQSRKYVAIPSEQKHPLLLWLIPIHIFDYKYEYRYRKWIVLWGGGLACPVYVLLGSL